MHDFSETNVVSHESDAESNLKDARKRFHAPIILMVMNTMKSLTAYNTHDGMIQPEKLSSHDRIVYKMGQSIQTIHMLGKTPNKVYDPFLKARSISVSISVVYKAKDTKSKNRVLKNTNDKSSSAHVQKVSSSFRIDSNKFLGRNCLTHYPLAAKSKNLGATSVVVKSRLSVAKTPTTTNKVSSALSLSPDSSQSDVVIQLVLWIVNNGCSKHMTGNLAICHVYYIEGLGHNLFSAGQFCDGYLEVAFRSNTCYVQNLKGDDLLTGSRDSNLYTISISELAASFPVCLMSKATSTKSWLWHRRLSHLNFGAINQLTSKDLVDGLPKFKYDKDHLCSACEQGKSKKASFPPKLVPSTESKLELLHMDLCGPMRVERPGFNCLNFQDSLKDLQSVPSKTDLDNLFGPLYEEYYATSIPEVTDNSAANTLDNEDTPSSSSIVVE
ncbi:integrase, catalytic region, zinc finger, CCHC-type containing protein [Tanacetum coccineum]